MNRKLMYVLFAATVFSLTASAVQAGLFRRYRRRLYRQPVRAQMRGQTWSSYQKVQRDQPRLQYPTRLWELGNHLGEWPPYTSSHWR